MNKRQFFKRYSFDAKFRFVDFIGQQIIVPTYTWVSSCSDFGARVSLTAFFYINKQN
jgi:hypothetical protein